MAKVDTSVAIWVEIAVAFAMTLDTAVWGTFGGYFYSSIWKKMLSKFSLSEMKFEHLFSSYARGEVDAPAAALPRLFLRS